MDRRVWWTVFMMDKIGMVLSDRPPLIPSDSAHPHLPLPEALWAQPPAPDGTYLEPIGANIPAAYMTLPDHDLLSQPDWRGWSEWGLVIMIHRALGEVVRWLQFCAAHRVDPYTAPSEQEKLHVRLARKQAVEMFREVLGFADTVYSRLPGYYAFLESAPELFLDPAAPGIAVPFERRAEAAHLLIYLHTSYALLFAPKVPDPESPSTRMWMKHQPLFGIPCGPSAPAERGGPAEFPFPMEPQWLAEGPDARLKPGAYCPSPAAQCHFHTQRVSHILQALLEKGGDRVMQQLPPFVMWCGSQTFFFRYLLANFTYAKLVATTHAGDHAGAVRKAIADTEEHLRIMGPLSRRWKAADASQKHIAHMLAEAAGGMVINENAVFSAVGIIHEAHGKTKVDRVIEGLEEVHDDGN
ncbi:hypothetical protein DFJ74DRAFT_685476 [Hyaloraphidium curvatum]|nr:hypothetical protein DFJ74DRAFT_685476 [Hyaloraphidium curvatum]